MYVCSAASVGRFWRPANRVEKTCTLRSRDNNTLENCEMAPPTARNLLLFERRKHADKLQTRQRNQTIRESHEVKHPAPRLDFSSAPRERTFANSHTIARLAERPKRQISYQCVARRITFISDRRRIPHCKTSPRPHLTLRELHPRGGPGR